MPRIVRDIQLLVNDDNDHLYGYRLSDGTEVRIGSSQPENAAAVVRAAGVRATTVAGKIEQVPALQAAGVKVLTAIIRNPLSDVAYSNEPAEIRVSFPDGWASEADCIKVRDPDGAYVDWQWEPARHARTDANISTHTSTNLKAGSVWVMVPSLPAGGSLTYTLEVWPTAQGQTPTAAVTTSTPDGNTDRYETSNIRADLVSGWSWNLKSYVRKAASFDVFGAVDSGLDFGFKPANAGTAEYSGLSTGTKSQAHTFKGERDSSTFGYGVVYRWRFNRSVGVTQANVQHEVRYRVFANGRIQVIAIHKALASITTSDMKLNFSVIKPVTAGGTHDGSNTGLWTKSDYGSNGRLLTLARSLKFNSDPDTTSSGAAFPGGSTFYTASPVRIRYGAQDANYVMPNDAERREEFWLSMLEPGASFEDEQLRIWNPLLTTAAKYSDRVVQLARFGVQARDFLDRYSAYSSTDSNSAYAVMVAGAWSSYALAGGGDQWSLVPARIDKWLSYSSRGPADSGLGARLFSLYTSGGGNSGWEYIGRDAGALYLIWMEAQRRGDSAVVTQAAACLRGIADHAVLCEAYNGSDGKIQLSSLDGVNLNAGAEAVMAMAFAKATGYSPNDGAMSRIWVALTGGVEQRNWPPYTFSSATSPNRSITDQVLSYFHRVMLAIYLVPRLARYSTNIDPRYCLMAATNPAGQALELRDGSNFIRRGSSPTLMHFASNLAMSGNVSEIEQAIAIMTHVNDESADNEPSDHPIDGWGNTNLRGVGDVQSANWMMFALRELL